MTLRKSKLYEKPVLKARLISLLWFSVNDNIKDKQLLYNS